MGDRLLRIPEVADRLGLTRSHVYTLIREGRFPVPVHRVAGLRVSERALEEWMAHGGEVARPAPVERAAVSRRRRAVTVPTGDTVVPFPG
jgi:excisionase family DNA binding protein